MSKTPFTVFGIFAVICVIVIPAYALSKEGDEDAGIVQVEPEDEEAKEIFFANCGPCHTLAAAGTDGIVGPDLDETLTPTGINTAENYAGNYGRVLLAVNCGREGRMPADIVVGEEAKEVAAFVAAYAGQVDKGPVVDTATAEKPEPEDCPTASG